MSAAQERQRIKALRWAGTQDFAFAEERIPAPHAADRVIVAPVLSGICGSDIGAMRLWNGERTPPAWPSHEILGRVVSAPDDSDLGEGELVVGWAAEFLGLAELVACDPTEVLAITPIEGVRLNDHIILQPLACVEHTIRRVRPGERVAIIGGGAIGLLFARRLRLDGHSVVVYDTVSRNYGTEADGIEFRRADVTDHAVPIEAFETVIECIGHDTRSITFAARLVAHDGTLSLFGVPSAGGMLPIADLFDRNVTVVLGTTTNHRLNLRLAFATLERHPELAQHYLTHTYPADQAAGAYRKAASTDPARCKVGIVWPTRRDEENHEQASA